VEIRPGQSCSGQAGSESCISGATLGVKRRQRESEPCGISSEIREIVADADAVSGAEGSIWATDRARLPGTAGVSNPGRALKGTRQKPGRALDPFLPLYGDGTSRLEWARPRRWWGCTSPGSEKASRGGVLGAKETEVPGTVLRAVVRPSWYR